MISDPLKKVFEKIPIGFMVLNEDAQVIFMNTCMAAKLGSDNAQNRSIANFFTERDSYLAFRNLLASNDGQCASETETTFINKDGQTISVFVTARKYATGIFLVCVQDISGQKAYEKVIGQSFDNFVKTTTDLDSAMKKIKEQHLILQDYKKKMMHELKIAEKVQTSLLPARPLTGKNYSVYGATLPSAQVGGDFFDYYSLDENKCVILLSDVSGHGVPSALITAMLKALFIEGVARTSDPGNILTYINRGITQSLEGTGFFLTAVCLLIDTQASRVSIANAGHDNPIKIKDGKASQLGENAGQTIIGTFTDISFHSTPAPIEKGDLIILFTDGITEARNKEGEFYQKEKLISALIENISVPLESKINLIMQSTEHYSAPAPPADDRTLILVQIH